MSLILASTSSIRSAMLGQTGIDYRVEPPSLDEDEVKQGFSGDDRSLARQLAEAKALSVACQPEDWVIGSDSVVSVGGRRYSKPRDRAEADMHLRAFSGQTMELSSAVSLVRGGQVDWAHAETATLHVRPLSPNFIASYLDAEWPDISYCVGVFRMEARGVTLFDRVEGSHFTVLGMPLLPLLGALRERGVMPS